MVDIFFCGGVPQQGRKCHSPKAKNMLKLKVDPGLGVH